MIIADYRALMCTNSWQQNIKRFPREEFSIARDTNRANSQSLRSHPGIIDCTRHACLDPYLIRLSQTAVRARSRAVDRKSNASEERAGNGSHVEIRLRMPKGSPSVSYAVAADR
ncbi:hypothetical protein HN011_008205 [Eciton burchellii]|nr:hypothetical protein HN011_008205 [Eciton burchellii]